jgi:Domain of unknown function (DUF4157)
MNGLMTTRSRTPFGSERASSNAALRPSVSSVVREALRAPGRPLDDTTRASMEQRFSHDFSQVRAHTDARAVESARAIGALAYTVGPDVAFADGQYAPNLLLSRSPHRFTFINAGKDVWLPQLLRLPLVGDFPQPRGQERVA